jgi:hypothetical protein
LRATKFQEFLRTQPFRPFVVRTTDDDTFKVDHPDFAMISRAKTEVAIFDTEDHFRLVAMKHIVSLEQLRNGSKKPGKR